LVGHGLAFSVPVGGMPAGEPIHRPGGLQACYFCVIILHRRAGQTLDPWPDPPPTAYSAAKLA
jgi:hypothetical protein